MSMEYNGMVHNIFGYVDIVSILGGSVYTVKVKAQTG